MFLRPHAISEIPSRPVFPSAAFRSLKCARFSRPISSLHGRTQSPRVLSASVLPASFPHPALLTGSERLPSFRLHLIR